MHDHPNKETGKNAITDLVLRLPFEKSNTYPANKYLKVPRIEKSEGSPLKRTTLKKKNQNIVDDFMTWSLPGHDLERPRKKHCGIFLSSDGRTPVVERCGSNPDDYCKHKRKHCWSLNCPRCMNDTALRQGVMVERELLFYQTLWFKKGLPVGLPSHFVVSPPQEFMKTAMQSKKQYDDVCKFVSDLLCKHGAVAGVTIFHPWRLDDDSTEWYVSPHFHVLLYGWIDTDPIKTEYPGWVVKKLHPKEQIRSIRHTVAYILTHSGQGLSEVSPEKVDFDLHVLDHLIPGILSEGATYNEADYEKQRLGKGRMCGDFSDMDWLEFTKKYLSLKSRIHYWGELGRNRMCKLKEFKLYRVRFCRCGDFIRVFDGYDDKSGSLSRYIQIVPVKCLARDKDAARKELKNAPRNGRELADFVRDSKIMVTELEFDRVCTDLILDNEFQEPDEYFLARQFAAFGDIE